MHYARKRNFSFFLDFFFSIKILPVTIYFMPLPKHEKERKKYFCFEDDSTHETNATPSIGKNNLNRLDIRYQHRGKSKIKIAYPPCTGIGQT